jgi:hypothetical protein
MTKYLTETILGQELEIIFPKVTFIRDKVVPDSGLQTRPDYRSEELKLIVEFDGDQHYKATQKIKREIQKSETYTQMGYKVVRIPYFVQLSESTIKNLFGIDIKYQQTFPHGFISKTVIMPADFCEMGVLKFQADLESFEYIRNDIIKSLKDKVIELGDQEFVLPNSMNYLFEE